jgi:pimeloyl-ACP methyl ester carboxylesterase
MGLLSGHQAAPEDFAQKVRTGGEIEAHYLADGPCRTASQTMKALQEFGSFAVHYPKDLEGSDKRYPVIVMCNGTGTPAEKYEAVFRHYASWGFITIGTGENHSWSGFGAEMCIRLLERLDGSEEFNRKKNIFFRKVDLERVGICGHSQGGVGAINAVTDTRHKDIYKAAAVLSPTNRSLAHDLLWDYDPFGIKTPIMMMSGAGGGDDFVVNLDGLREIYDSVRSPKLMARRAETPHGETLYSETGYITAWFMWRLNGDAEAAKAFAGERPEIMENPMYQDQRIDL